MTKLINKVYVKIMVLGIILLLFTVILNVDANELDTIQLRYTAKINSEDSTISIDSPELEIKEVKAKFGSVSVIIENVGTVNISDVSWNISVNGGLFGLINRETEGIIGMLNVGDTISVQTDNFIFGLGQVCIAIDVMCSDTWFGTGVVIGPFILDINKLDISNSKFGSHFSPKHLPESFWMIEDINEYYELSHQMGEHSALNVEWIAEDFHEHAKALTNLSRDNGFKTHFYMSPISLADPRDKPAIPPSVGGNSFSDPIVREAYKEWALDIASIEPTYLGIGNEVNLLAANETEYPHFVTLIQETYDHVKQYYPDQIICVSFQWDVIKLLDQYELFDDFSESVDLFAFTSYPNILVSGDPQEIPDDYFSSMINYLPTERIGVAELGWFSGSDGSEELQAEFFERLPELIDDADLEYFNLILMHDLPIDLVPEERFSTLGVRNWDGTPKLSWDIIINYP